MDKRGCPSRHETGHPRRQFLAPLVRYLYHSILQMENGAVLDVGWGEGKNAIFLTQKGFDVDADEHPGVKK
jgi:hypothetical protein